MIIWYFSVSPSLFPYTKHIYTNLKITFPRPKFLIITEHCKIKVNASGPPTSLQMAQFCSFCVWVIFHFIYMPHLQFPCLCWWTSRLLPCSSYCKWCCNKHWGACIFLGYGFLSVYAQKCFLLITDIIIRSLFPVTYITGLAGAGMSPATGSSDGHSPASAWKELCPSWKLLGLNERSVQR